MRISSNIDQSLQNRGGIGDGLVDLECYDLASDVLLKLISRNPLVVEFRLHPCCC